MHNSREHTRSAMGICIAQLIVVRATTKTALPPASLRLRDLGCRVLWFVNCSSVLFPPNSDALAAPDSPCGALGGSLAAVRRGGSRAREHQRP